MSRLKSIQIVKTGAAAMANVTRGRKTKFKSKAEVLKRIKKKEAKEQIDEVI